MSIPVPSALELVVLCGTATAATCGAFFLRDRAKKHVPEEEHFRYYQDALQDFLLYLGAAFIGLGLMIMGFGFAEWSGNQEVFHAVGRVGLGIFMGVNILASLYAHARTPQVRDPEVRA